MGYDYVASSVERSVIQNNAPTSAAITTALQVVPFNDTGWVGPAPRVTRSYQSLALSANLTHLAWVFQLDAPSDQAMADAAASAMVPAIQSALATTSSDWDPVTVMPFNEAVNGPLSWWQSGQDAASPTQDAWPELGGRLAANENPLGPNTASTTLPTLGQGFGQQLQASGLVPVLTTLAWVAAGGIVLYLTWPLLTGLRRSEGVAADKLGRRAPPETTRAARPNPVRARLRSAAGNVGAHDYVTRAVIRA